MRNISSIILVALILLNFPVLSQEGTPKDSEAPGIGRGWLALKVSVNGEPVIPGHEVRYWIFPRENPNDLVESALISSADGNTVSVPEDIYTAKVCYMDIVGKPFLQKDDIYVPTGGKVDEVFNLDTAKIQITADARKGPLMGYQQVKVWVYEHPGKAEYGFYGTIQDETGLTVECLPGVYDIKIEYSSAPARPVIWDRKIDLSAGDQVSKHYFFPQGEILVSVEDPGGEMIAGWTDVRYWLFDHQTGEELTYGTIEKPSGHSILMPPGIYDLKMQYSGVLGSPEEWLMGIEVEENKTVSKKIQFTSAKLKLRAEAFGRELTGWREIACWIIEAAGGREIFYGTLEPGKNEVLIKEGIYDIKFQFSASENNEIQWVRNVTLTEGKTGYAGVRFSAGYLEVEAYAGDRPLHGWQQILLWIYEFPSGKEILASTLEKGPPKNRFVLTEGKYHLKAQYVAGDFAPVKEIEDIIIRDMETTKIDIRFNGSSVPGD